MTRSRRRRRFVDMAGPVVDPHARPMTRGEKVGAVLVAIEIVLCLWAATLFLPDKVNDPAWFGADPAAAGARP